MNKDIKKVVLAYSGGLDTSVILKWLIETYKCEVITVTADLGQPEDLSGVEAKAYKTGASKAYVVDLREEMARDFVFPMMRGAARYENRYMLGTSIARPIITKALVDIARKEGADAIAHGATGKGNDQVRFETSIQALDPSIAVIAPVREWDLLTREQEMEWAKEHGVPVPTTIDKPYSIDDNLFGRAIECGVLENPWNEPPADIWTMTADPQQAPDAATEVVIGFEKGKPVSLNGEKKSLLKIIIELNAIAGANGYGRIDMIEDRVVGIKSRECYECPASLALIAAHKSLETMCLDHDTLYAKQALEGQWATLVYDGLWYSPLKQALDAFVANTQEFVTGEVRAKFYKGTLTVTGHRAANSLYVEALATYSDGDEFDRTAFKGFIKLHSLPSQTWSKQQGPAYEHARAVKAGKVKLFVVAGTPVAEGVSASA